MSKKQEIIQAAINLFALQGYEKTAITAICEQANVSKGAVFHYFKNKEELLREAFIEMSQCITDVEGNLRNINQGLTPVDMLVNLFEQIFSSMALAEKQLSYQFEFQLLSQASMRLILKDLIEKRYQEMQESFTSILRDIPSSQNIVDSHMLIAEIDGIALNFVFADDSYPLEAIKKRFINKYLLLLGFEKRYQ